MTNITIQCAVANNKGRVRGNNEDNFYMNGKLMPRAEMDKGASLSGQCSDAYQLYAVCDGMGGADCGEEASFCAVNQLYEQRTHLKEMTDPGYMTALLRAISDQIYTEAARRGQNSGATVALALLEGNRVHLANVGDSRAYFFRAGNLRQVSLDHSMVNRLISMGMLTPEQAKTDKRRHVITQHLGMPEEVQISPYIDESLELQTDDVLLLCSDGLTDMVTDEQISSILASSDKPREAAQALLSAALMNGGADNVTIMVLKAKKIGGAASPGTLKKILTAAQILAACGFIVTLADYIFYLLKR